MRVRIKVCGITCVKQALMVESMGVDAIGVVLYSGSLRCISIEQAIKIHQSLGSFTTLVGLFVDEEVDKVLDTATTIGLDVVQLHGRESVDYCRQIKYPYIKAIPATEENIKLSSAYITANGILFDTPSSSFGGSGQTFDWNILPTPLPKNTIIAGGLNNNNVLSVLNKNPYAVDVSSSLESEVGIKNEQLVADFISSVRSYGI